jgi:hypothetical protein
MAALKFGVNLAAACDVDRPVIDKRLGELEQNNVDISNIKYMAITEAA